MIVFSLMSLAVTHLHSTQTDSQEVSNVSISNALRGLLAYYHLTTSVRVCCQHFNSNVYEK